MMKHPTRRDVMKGAATLATGVATLATGAVVSGAVVGMAEAAASGDTPIARLWAEAEQLRHKLAPYQQQIEAAERSNISHLSGWVYLDGEARSLGSARHDVLMKLLISEPQNRNDLRLMSAAAKDHEMIKSPGLWAVVRIEDVAQRLALAA